MKQGDHAAFCYLRHAVGLAFLSFTVIVGLAIYRSKDDPSTVALVLASYLLLLLFCYSVRHRERTSTSLKSPGSWWGKLKVAVWLCSVEFTGMYTYRVADIMPLPMAIVVWAMVGFTVSVGFYAFIHRETPDGGSSGKTTSPV